MDEVMLTATAAEIQRNFGHWQDKALQQPVRVTRNGRPKVVILSVEEYQRLRRRDRQALRIEELSRDELAAIATAEPPAEAVEYDGEVG